MKKYRSAQVKVKAEKINMGGIILDQALPLDGIEQIDPFLLIHHWYEKYPGDQQQRNLGVGPHPHRGFAPVTLIFKGSVHHRDSEGFNSVVSAGGTQWMNAGRGIIHSERPGKDLAEQGGEYEIIQFWVNAPAKYKLDDPFYQPLHSDDTPTYITADQLVHIDVVAGEFEALQSSIKPYSPMSILNIRMESGGKIDIPLPQDYNALVYVLDGNVNLNDAAIMTDKELIWLANDGDYIKIAAHENTRLIILAGEPIDEPLHTYGPFVMNSQQELMNAIQDFQKGEMGQLVEEFD